MQTRFRQLIISSSWRISSLAEALQLQTFQKKLVIVSGGVYTLDQSLGIMTGRTTCILGGMCTTPLPLPFEEDHLTEPAAAELLNDAVARDERIDKAMASHWIRHMPLNPTGNKETTYSSGVRDNSWVKSLLANYGLCHLYYCDLAIMVQEIVNKVYSMDCVMVPWAHIENRIGGLKARIDLWRHSLPSSLDFAKEEDEGPDRLRYKLVLAFQYYSGRITLGRPCLCRRDVQKKSPADTSTFSHDMVELTLESANLMLDLIPDEPNATQLYEISPWWCILHYLMQATTVLLLELSFGCVHMPDEEQKFIVLAKKSVQWLFAMSTHSIASRRAWKLCDVNLRRLASEMKFNVSDMPQHSNQAAPTSSLSVNNLREAALTNPSGSGPWKP